MFPFDDVTMIQNIKEPSRWKTESNQPIDCRITYGALGDTPVSSASGIITSTKHSRYLAVLFLHWTQKDTP